MASPRSIRRKFDLLFSRFVSAERNEPPDIDVDFEHERREEVIQHIYQRYGRHRAGIAATVIHFRPRSAVREVGKVLGLSEDVTTRLTSTVWGSFADRMETRRFTDAGFDLAAPDLARLKWVVDQLLHAPRHLSQHVGGFVLTQDRLDETVPIHNAAMDDRTFIEWDKDDIDALGLMKVDILALGMLTCIRKAFDLMERHGLGRWTLATIPQNSRRSTTCSARATASACSRSRAARRSTCCPASSRASSTISRCRSRSCGPARSRATWSIPICERREELRLPASPDLPEARPGTIPTNSRRCSAKPSACRCSRNRR